MRPHWKVFLTGAALWAATVVVTVVTANSNLIPTIVLLGSFLVPVTFVVWAYEHGRDNVVTVELLFKCFVIGGVLGVLGASVLESYLGQSLWMYFAVGLIEEGVKVAALLLVARGIVKNRLRDGAVLGATVGFGFASFESAGYAFNALFTDDGLSLIQMVETEILRGVLAPVGHGLWSAILGAVLFSQGGRLTARFLLAYLGVSLLHGLWDSMSGLAVAITLILTGKQWQFHQLELGELPGVTDAQTHLYTILNWGGLALISIIAIFCLSRLLKKPVSP
ncbi:PrsW family glutamic-type intramembrane protease [Nonomuraea sp. NPDC050310]|uniref:PrsW family intramembrane metalloprotease n=1 Tax=unclassified Nonomuraea TaxID=2593643 RepID=UPI003411B75E